MNKVYKDLEKTLDELIFLNKQNHDLVNKIKLASDRVDILIKYKKAETKDEEEFLSFVSAIEKIKNKILIIMRKNNPANLITIYDISQKSEPESEKGKIYRTLLEQALYLKNQYHNLK